MFRDKFSKAALPLFLTGSLWLAGCQAEVYTGLTEEEANNMLAVLLSNGIQTQKAAAGKEGFTLTVDDKDLLRAIGLLKDHGFPNRTRESVGKVFQKSGIMSSPFEERVRYVYALGEDIAQTLSNIDGVVAARVHIVLPEAPQLGQPVKPSSAAVFIKHRPGVDLDFFVPQIRRLVSSSIEGLEYSAVTVVLADAAPTKITASTSSSASVSEVLPGLKIAEADQTRFWEIFVSETVLILLLIVTNISLIFYFRSKGKSPPAEGEEAENLPTIGQS